MSQKRDTYSPARIYVSLEPNLFPPTLGHCADFDARQGILRVLLETGQVYEALS